jgi:regulator of replication initiation timing
LHKKICPQNNTNQIKDLTNLVQSLTEKIQALNLENESLKLQVQNIDDIIRFFFVELCNYLELNSET